MRNRAYIYDRGALSGGLVGEISDPIMTQWGRLRDDTSEGRVSAKASLCARIVQPANVGRYELVIERDGKREWEGPITYLNTKNGVTDIRAKDISWYLNRTALTREWKHTTSVFCVDRLESIMRYELARKEQMGYRILEGLIVKGHPEGARTKKNTLPYEKYVFEELDDMAWRQGIDYTVVRRHLLMNDTDTDVGSMRPLTSADFDGESYLTTYGVELATRSIVTDGLGRAGIYEGLTGDGEHPYYGEVVLLHTEYNEQDEPGTSTTPVTVLESQAQRNYVGRERPMTVLKIPQNSRIVGCVADELMPYMVPGVRTEILLDDPGLPRLSEMMRLDSMKVTETSDGEEVTATFKSSNEADEIIDAGDE